MLWRTGPRFPKLVLIAAVLLLIPTTARAEPPIASANKIVQLEAQVAALQTEIATIRAERLNDRLMDRLRGHWDESCFYQSGQQQREKDPVDWRLDDDVSSDRLVLADVVDGGELGTMTLDATKNPAWVTFRRVAADGSVWLLPGIVKYEYQRATIALPAKPLLNPEPATDYPQRPKTFETTPENGVVVYHLVRSEYRRMGR